MWLIVIKEKGLRYRLEAYFAFYELSKLRIDERIIETLEEGKVGPLITDRMGAYLSGSWGEGPFLRYMAYLGEYLRENVGACVGNINIYQLWADGFILISDSIQGIQEHIVYQCNNGNKWNKIQSICYLEQCTVMNYIWMADRKS